MLCLLSTAYYAPAQGALSDDARLMSDVCLSVAYIGPKSRSERPRKTAIGTEVAHVTCDLDTAFKVKRSKVRVTRPLYSPPCWWAWERVGCEKLLLRCRLLGRARRFGTHRGGEGRGHIVAAARLLLIYKLYCRLSHNIVPTTSQA